MTDAPPDPGLAQELAPGIRRILAPNPSPMTHWGTNTYILGAAELAIVDPGPDDPAHLGAILAATRGARVRTILVTHAHRDHSLGVPALARATGAEVLGFGPATAGRSAQMAALATHPGLGGGEGLDAGFAPHRRLGDGDSVTVEGARVQALHTPGHFAGHLSFALGDTLLSGDLVMGWASTLISPPDGDLAEFMASCERLLSRGETRFLPGHGAPLEDPRARIRWLLEHRRGREAQILDALASGPATPAALAARIYADQPAHVLPAATRNVLAHLIDLTARGRAQADRAPGPDAVFTAA